jgi:glycerol-3-phosphate cytidylyltransferase
VKYCFDLDETLCLTPASRDYSKAVPIWPMINDVNMMYEEGHEIWIFTTRGSTSGIDHHELNLRQLTEWGVKHHHLVDKGKPPVDFFIDDKAINVKDWRSQRGVLLVGFVASSFDLLHAGHCLYLKEAKSVCDRLIAGLQTDPTLDRPNKSKPVQSVEERLIQLEACRYVDRVVKYNTEEDLEKILKVLKPALRFIGSTDAPDNGGPPITGSQHCGSIYFHDRSHNYSSSELKRRISDAC